MQLSATPQSTTALLDVFYKVPELLQSCIGAWHTRGDGIRALRLVCKDLSSIAPSAIKWCGVQIGDKALPEPRLLARLLCNVVLEGMDVTVLVKTARQGAPDVSHQLATAIAHVSQLTNGMQSIINGLASLYLTVRLVPHNMPRSPTYVDSLYKDDAATQSYKEGKSGLHVEDWGKSPGNAAQVTCPSHLEVIPREVFEMLALAVASLQHLSLMGYCGDGVLSVFGLLCPELHSVRVEASSVPMKALHHLHQHIPRLTHFSLFKRGPRGNNLQNFTVESFALLRPCTKLLSLQVDYGSKVQIILPKETWYQLPPGVCELHSTSPFPTLRDAEFLLSKLNTLDVLASPYPGLLELLRLMPCLQTLIVQHDEFVKLNVRELYNSDGTQAHDLLALQRQLSTMHITCSCFLLRASSTSVGIMLNWLQPVRTPKLTVQVSMYQDAPLKFLKRIPSSFPDLTTLELMDVRSDSNTQLCPEPLSEDLLKAVMGCKALEKLDLRMHFTLSTHGLTEICRGLPHLESVKCYSGPGLDYKEVQQSLRPERPRFKINHLCDASV